MIDQCLVSDLLDRVPYVADFRAAGCNRSVWRTIVLAERFLLTIRAPAVPAAGIFHEELIVVEPRNRQRPGGRLIINRLTCRRRRSIEIYPANHSRRLRSRNDMHRCDNNTSQSVFQQRFYMVSCLHSRSDTIE